MTASKLYFFYWRKEKNVVNNAVLRNLLNK
jgi:hypothetical protein